MVEMTDLHTNICRRVYSYGRMGHKDSREVDVLVWLENRWKSDWNAESRRLRNTERVRGLEVRTISH